MKDAPWTFECDDITLVTLLQADKDISVSHVEPVDDENKKAKNVHCVWHLLVRGYTPEDIQRIVGYFYAFGGKCSPSERDFSFQCPECGINWVNEGPCGDECLSRFVGRFPDFHYFDAVKRDVISQKRQAQEELAAERGEGRIYA